MSEPLLVPFGAALEPKEVENLGLLVYNYVPAPQQDSSKEKAARRAHLKTIVSRPLDDDILGRLASRRRKLFEDIGAIPVPVHLVTDYLCGLAHQTVLLNGMTVLRPWGIPLVTAEGIKGHCRQWLACCLEERLHLTDDEATSALRDAGCLTLFASPVKDQETGFELPGRFARGDIQFFDAIPAFDKGTCEIRLSGTTPHEPGWYAGSLDAPPDGMDNPVPVQYLSVRRRTPFDLAFRYEGSSAWSPDFSSTTKLIDFEIDADAKDASTFFRSLLLSTAKFNGFGAGTASGHGRFEPGYVAVTV